MVKYIKITAVTMLLVFVTLVTTFNINGAMTSNVDFPPNQASNSWSEPVITYNGQYVISLSGTSNSSSKSITISIPMGDVMYFVFTYYDVNMNAKQINSQNNGFDRYDNVLIDYMGNFYNVYTQTLDNEVHTWKLEVYTIFNFASGGGNTGTWRTNIMNFAYVSQSPLFGQLSVISDAIYESAYDKGYQDGDSDAYSKYADYWKDLGYQVGFNDGVASTSDFSITGLLFQVFSGLGAVLAIELLPNITIGALVAIPLVFGIIYFILGKRGSE